MAEELKGVPADFVYAGRRAGKTGFVHVIYILKDGHELGEKFVAGGKVFGRYGKHIGAVYRGARFEPGTAYGLGAASYEGPFKGDMSLIAGWEALDAEYATAAAMESAERKQKPVVQQELLSLRRMLHAMRKRGAHHEVHALMQLVNQEMYRPLTQEEQA